MEFNVMSWILVTEFECAVLDFNVLYWIHARTHARTHARLTHVLARISS